jgi:hypothetical protein
MRLRRKQVFRGKEQAVHVPAVVIGTGVGGAQTIDDNAFAEYVLKSVDLIL